MPETALGLSAFRDALREAYGDKYYPDTKLTEDEIRSELGMDDSLYEEVYAENTAQKAHPDTFIAVKVKEGKTDEVKEKLAAYKQRLLADEDFTASKDKIEAAEIEADRLSPWTTIRFGIVIPLLRLPSISAKSGAGFSW